MEEKMSNENKVKVSIVIPVYNVEQYLRECVDSVINQTLKEIEIICVNDGSKDGSLAILEEYAKKDSRVKVFSKPNSGYGHTMNVGLDAATGEYIGIVESDDYVKPDMYETLYNLAKEHDLDIIKADFYRFMDEDGKLKLEYNELVKGQRNYYNCVLDPAVDTDVFKFIMNTWSGIYKKSFLDQYHIRHNETPGASFQDNGFFFQTFCQAKRIYFVDKPFYMNRRDNPNSSVKSKDKVFCMRDEYVFIRDFLESKPELKEKFIQVYWLKKYHNYLFTYRRVAEEFKMLFLTHFGEDFRQAKENGELDPQLFTPLEWENIHKIIEDPQAFHLERSKKKQAGKKNYIKAFFGSVKEKGLSHTLRRVKNKLQGF
jgi:glycosyltransferase involved in cell wall biosynthesis